VLYHWVTVSCKVDEEVNLMHHMGGSSKLVAGRSGSIGSVLLALPVRFQNALKRAWNCTCNAQKLLAAGGAYGSRPSPLVGWPFPRHLALSAFCVLLRRLGPMCHSQNNFLDPPLMHHILEIIFLVEKFIWLTRITMNFLSAKFWVSSNLWIFMVAERSGVLLKLNCAVAGC